MKDKKDIKVGDKVKVLNNNDSYLRHSLKISDIVECIVICSDDNHYFINKDGNKQYMAYDCYELVESNSTIPDNCIISTESKEEWDKLMDYIWDNGMDKRCSSDRDDWKGFYETIEGSAKIEDGNLAGCCSLEWYKGESEYNDYKFIKASDVLGGKSSKSHKFKVGDTVEALVNTGDVWAGKYYKVIDVCGDIQVDVLNSPYKHFLNFNQVKLISKGETPSGIKTPVKNSIMDRLRKIPSTLKRVLDTDLSAMYKVGFINGDLALTEDGNREVLNYLITTKEVKKAIAEVAKEIIKDTEKK